MEKYAERFRANFRGLLILVFLAEFFPVFAKPVSWNYLWSLRFKQSQETLFTETDSSFYVEIANVTPDSIQIAVNSLPQNVSFVSSKKETVMIKAENDHNNHFATGTRITIWMRFQKTGTYKINPVDLTINEGFYQIPFNPVEVFENPRFINPDVSVSFNNLISAKNRPIEIQEGQPVIFTVNVKYAKSVQGVTWNIPEDSVFKKIREYPISDGDSFSTDFQPAVIFEWKPLKTGEWKLPEIFLTAVSYNGSVCEVKCPDILFKVIEAETEYAEKKTESPFAYAFIEPPVYEKAHPEPSARSEEIVRLVELHRKERHSIPFLNPYFAEKKSLEAAVGLSSSGREPSVVFFSMICFVAFLLMLSFVVLFICKRRITCGIVLSVLVTVFVSVFIYGYHLFTVRGVYAGGAMSPIPEKSVPNGVTIQAGSVVFIIRTAGDWMYIRQKDTYGWVPAENVYLIK
ncbi:hypothetical protein [Treponema sp.]|uniref:hypothetical protein n=1 Tax=Treponema sp. TaxID=166 RepID=UPI003F06E4D6